ncbi:MAG: mechanosensitive ion channel [Patescibacteria group bacterium]|nr:mechanosensitive ion channel [Patescibacteria group bacterium]
MNTIQEFIINIVKQSGVDIVLIIALFFLGRVVLRMIVKRFVLLVDDGDDAHTSQKEKRAETLGHIIVTTGNIVIYVVILLMALSLFGVNIAPILAGAGVVGLAIGFGAQSLVKDFVSGLFILVENQYGIGDKVKIGSFEGKVVKITMRSTALRDDEGKTFYISNGLIKDVVNFSQKKRGIIRD